MLTARRDGEDVISFTIRRFRNEVLEEAALTVLMEKVDIDTDPDPTDLSYNIALEHAAEAIRQMRA